KPAPEAKWIETSAGGRSKRRTHARTAVLQGFHTKSALCAVGSTHLTERLHAARYVVRMFANSSCFRLRTMRTPRRPGSARRSVRPRGSRVSLVTAEAESVATSSAYEESWPSIRVMHERVPRFMHCI